MRPIPFRSDERPVYRFLADKALPRGPFVEGLKALKEDFALSWEDERKGELLASFSFGGLLNGLTSAFWEDLGTSLSFLRTPKASPLGKRLLPKSLAYFPNRLVFISDVLLREFSFGNFESLPYLSAEFSTLPKELLLTAGAYLRCGMNASLAASSLYIHRNTFNYRMGKFLELTGYDIRDYHDALVLELYFELCAKD